MQNMPKMECAAREARGWLLLSPGPAARFARLSPIFVYFFKARPAARRARGDTQARRMGIPHEPSKDYRHYGTTLLFCSSMILLNAKLTPRRAPHARGYPTLQMGIPRFGFSRFDTQSVLISPPRIKGLKEPRCYCSFVLGAF